MSLVIAEPWVTAPTFSPEWWRKFIKWFKDWGTPRGIHGSDWNIQLFDGVNPDQEKNVVGPVYVTPRT